jgi:DNA-binding response OmpR family regulator
MLGQYITERSRAMESPARILAVDDVEAVRAILQAALSQSGYEVGTASNGMEAIEKLRTEHYDLVITDWRMPGRGGMDVAREVRNLGLRIPVLILTAEALEDHESLLQLVGANLALQKPLSLDELYDAVDKSLRGRKEERREVGRLTLNDPCTLILPGRELSGRMVSLGIKGVSVHLSEYAGSLDESLFRVKVHFPSEVLRFNVRLRSQMQHPEGGAIIGCEFENLSAEDMQKVKARLIAG